LSVRRKPKFKHKLSARSWWRGSGREWGVESSRMSEWAGKRPVHSQQGPTAVGLRSVATWRARRGRRIRRLRRL